MNEVVHKTIIEKNPQTVYPANPRFNSPEVLRPMSSVVESLPLLCFNHFSAMIEITSNVKTFQIICLNKMPNQNTLIDIEKCRNIAFDVKT